MLLILFSIFLQISQCYALANYTFNKDIIPHDMKEFQQQTRDYMYTNPLTKGELDRMIENTESVIPDFDLDSIKDSSKRFEKLKATYDEMKKTKSFKFETTSEENILRQKKKTTKNKEKEIKKSAMQRAIDLMTQFVYAARYKLTLGQMLRTEYKSKLEYKIGYCFALMRDIRQQQLLLYSAMHFNYVQYVDYKYVGVKGTSYHDLQSYFQMYEKIAKLDVDMKDVVALAQKLMNIRKMNPSSRPTTDIS
ncbi:uncharacterized protein LOC125238898 [Leguminivora glycinivorella]|uniref:uncharacterized protein LOC125238898 n=1 Tax=Leguminivora glycinivorella TaxID=1035111 RepID=UPI00200D3D9A|nr:uncharacterized protein LOC125238898 [Leguminivora glycinivorella]